MKDHLIQMTITLNVKASSVEDAQRIAEDMDIKFTNPDTGYEIEYGLNDWNIQSA